jgi:hypothetical protein
MLSVTFYCYAECHAVIMLSVEVLISAVAYSTELDVERCTIFS